MTTEEVPMTQPEPDEPAQEARPASPEPTVRGARPPVPGRAARAEVAVGDRATPPVHPDDPTVTVAGPRPAGPHRTLAFGTPTPVRVTVGPRRKPRRRLRSWPWIAAVVLALLVLGVVLLVMMLRGATIDGGTDLVGAGLPPAPGVVVSSSD
jgi:hypothetical protein